MRRHAARGDRPAVARQFRVLRDELARLGTQPAEETLALRRELARGPAVQAARFLHARLERDAPRRGSCSTSGARVQPWAGDHAQGSGCERPTGGPPRDRRERGAVCPTGYHVAAATLCARAGRLERGREFLARGERVAGRWAGGPWSAAVAQARAELLLAEGDRPAAAAALRST